MKKTTLFRLVAVLLTLLVSAYRCNPNLPVFSSAPATTEEPAQSAPTQMAEPTARPTTRPTQPASTQTAEPLREVVPGDGKAMAEEILGETLPWPPAKYVAGGPGMPDDCAGLCYNTDTSGVLLWYGPNAGEEDITLSDASFGNGKKGPLDLMRDGDVHAVIFAITKDAQMEVCPVPGSKLDGKLISEWLGTSEGGECGRFAIEPGWHVVEDSMNSPVAGFGVRFGASGWSGMTESQIMTYTGYWDIKGDTATWSGPANVEIMLTPAMVSMMQDFGTLTKVVFTTSSAGSVMFCNGNVTGAATLNSPDGSCQMHDVPAGTFTYYGEPRTSAGISWQPNK